MQTFYNQATLSYNGNTVTSNIVQGELVEVLSASKTATPSVYSQGETVTYVINLINSGATALTNLTLTDDLGGYEFNGATLYPLDYNEGSVRYFVNGIQQASPAATAGPPLSISGISVPVGGNATVVYTANVNDFAPYGTAQQIENTVTVSGAGITTPASANAIITANEEANLSIAKSISPSTVAENGQLTYTFVISNTGASDAIATDNIIVTDTFNPILDPISVSYNGAAWTEGTDYTYDTATGIFTTTAGQITVPAATYTQDAVTGEWIITPGTSTLTVTGTV